jgi:hypothetical protein
VSPYSPKKINRLVGENGKTGKFGMLSRFWKGLFYSRGNLPSTATVLSNKSQRLSNFVARGTLRLSLIVFLLAGIGWFSYLLLAGSDIFHLTSVTVVGNRTVAEDDIIRTSGLVHGACLLKFAVDEAEGKIAALDWVDNVDIVISWPSRVVINILEHKPFALVNLKSGQGKGKKLHYVDYRGNIFSIVSTGYDLDFPVISGDIDSFVSGGDGDKRIEKESLGHEALKLLRLAARGNAVLPGRAVSEVSVDSRHGLVLFLVEYPFPIYMGDDNIRTQYYRLVKILARLYRNGTVNTIKEIRMNYLQSKALVAKNAPVR